MIRTEMSEQALMELLRRRPAPAGLASAPAPGTLVGGDTADDLAIGDEQVSSECDDLDASFDLAALRQGCLSPDGIQRLARHVARCVTCKYVVATIVAEVSHAESTGTHAAAPERDDPRK